MAASIPASLHISRVNNITMVTISTTITVVIPTTAVSSSPLPSPASHQQILECLKFATDIVIFSFTPINESFSFDRGVTISPGNLLPCRTDFDEIKLLA